MSFSPILNSELVNSETIQLPPVDIPLEQVAVVAPPLCIHKWFVEGKELSLFKKPNELFCSLYNPATEERFEFPLPLNNGLEVLEGNVAGQEYYFTNCDAVLREDNPIPVLFDPIDEENSVQEWTEDNTILIRAYRRENALFCQRFNKTTRIASSIPVDFEHTSPIDERVAHLAQAIIDRMIVENDCLGNIVFKRARSKFDDAVIINRNNWGITLVSTGAKWYGHAKIAIEGVSNKGIQFLHYADLRLAGNKSVNCSGTAFVTYKKRLEYTPPVKQTQTWLRTKDKVQRMINQILWEVLKQEDNEPQVFFDLLGSDSCKVNPIRVRSTQIADRSDLFRQEFADSVVMQGPYFKGTELRLNISRSTQNIKLALKGSGIIATSFINESRSSLVHYVLSSDASNRMDEYIYPDNCITWARKKLMLADIDLPPSASGSLVTIPSNYIGNTSSLNSPPVAILQPGNVERVFLQERVRVPVSIRNGVKMVDITQNITHSEGASWKLTADSVDFLHSQRELNTLSTIEDDSPLTIREMLRYREPINISIFVNGDTKTIEINPFLLRKFSPWNFYQEMCKPWLPMIWNIVDIIEVTDTPPVERTDDEVEHEIQANGSTREIIEYYLNKRFSGLRFRG